VCLYRAKNRAIIRVVRMRAWTQWRDRLTGKKIQTPGEQEMSRRRCCKLSGGKKAHWQNEHTADTKAVSLNCKARGRATEPRIRSSTGTRSEKTTKNRARKEDYNKIWGRPAQKTDSAASTGKVEPRESVLQKKKSNDPVSQGSARRGERI